MARFFDNHELILLILLILLFDLNSFCDMSLQHIIYKEKRDIITFVIIVLFLLADTYVFYTVCETAHINHKECSDDDIRYKVVRDENNDILTENLTDDHDIMTPEEIKTDKNIKATEYIVGNFVVLVLIAIVIAALLSKSKDDMQTKNTINSTKTKLLLSIPIFLAMIAILLFINIPRKNNSKIRHSKRQ